MCELSISTVKTVPFLRFVYVTDLILVPVFLLWWNDSLFLPFVFLLCLSEYGVSGQRRGRGQKIATSRCREKRDLMLLTRMTVSINLGSFCEVGIDVCRVTV